MATFRNSVIINHEILHSGAAEGKGYQTVTRQGLDDMFHYYSGEGRHEHKDVDKHLTEADLYLESKKQLDDMFDYYGRSGRFEGRNPERPLADGQKSGAVWDLEGITDVEAAKGEILASGTNAVKTVVSVSRDWAKALHLTTKEEWQALVRSTWPEFMDAWGLVPKIYQRCCAWMHTDNEKNIHVHVLSWDRSGHYFTGEQRIPHERIEPSKEVVRKAIFKQFALERSLEKAYVREAAILNAKSALGYDVKPSDIERVSSLAEKAGITAPAIAHRVEGERGESLERLLERAAASMPASGIGRTGYNSVSLDARAAANLAVMELKRAPQIGQLADRWKELVDRGADMLGKHGWARDEYVAREVRDLDRRIANAFLRKASDLNQPWLRDPALKVERAEILRICEKEIPSYVARKGSDQLLEVGAIERKTALWGGYKAMEDDVVCGRVSEYCKSVVEYAQTNHDRPLEREQVTRLYKRASADLAAALGGAVRRESFRELAGSAAWRDKGLMKSAVFTARVPQAEPRYMTATLNAEQRKIINADLDVVKASLKNQGNIDRAALSRISSMLLNTPEVKSSIATVSHMMTCDVGEKRAFKESLAERRESIEAYAVERMAKEVQYDAERAAQDRTATLEGLVKTALMAKGQQDSFLKALEFRLKRHHEVSEDRSTKMRKGL